MRRRREGANVPSTRTMDPHISPCPSGRHVRREGTAIDGFRTGDRVRHVPSDEVGVVSDARTPPWLQCVFAQGSRNVHEDDLEYLLEKLDYYSEMAAAEEADNADTDAA